MVLDEADRMLDMAGLRAQGLGLLGLRVLRVWEYEFRVCFSGFLV